ncbi:MAG: zf-HC2 domain-containing protein [Acidobacteriota bacterium]|nr:zf-HC2 domain-containing protein [Acidobacteriota bacterium]
MSCSENDNLIHACLDGELDLLRSLKLEAHLQECSSCAQAFKNYDSLCSAMRAGSLHFKPPKDLAGRIHLVVEQARRSGRCRPSGAYQS